MQIKVTASKESLRKSILSKRRNIENKGEKDELIRENLICNDLYLNAKQVLFYAPLNDEINIDDCINDALMLKKRVALPTCTDNNGNMKFYNISSLDDLKLGHFGVREPDTDKCEEVTDFNNSICVVPALAFSKKGFRLGYGKGYYDRFLKNYISISIGLCYNELVLNELPTDEFDIPVNYVITENSIITV